MPVFRAFVITIEGHIRSAINLVCDTEDEAKEKAQALATDEPVELWQGPHRIARFKPGRMPQ